MQKKPNEDNIFTGTNKLAKTAIKAHDKGGLPLVLLIIFLIIILFVILLNSHLGTFLSAVLIVIGFFIAIFAVIIYLKEKKLI